MKLPLSRFCEICGEELGKFNTAPLCRRCGLDLHFKRHPDWRARRNPLRKVKSRKNWYRKEKDER